MRDISRDWPAKKLISPPMSVDHNTLEKPDVFFQIHLGISKQIGYQLSFDCVSSQDIDIQNSNKY